MAVMFAKTSFPYADGVLLLTAETDWTRNYGTGSPVIISNRVRQDGPGDTFFTNNVTTADPNQTVFADLYCASGLTGDAFGVLARVSGARTAIYAGVRYTAGAFEVRAFSFVNGTPTQIGANVIVPFAVGTTKRLQLEVSGQSPNISVVVKFDGTTHISSSTVNVSALDVAGLAGFRLSSTASNTDLSGMQLAGITATEGVAVTDTTAPVLSLPTGTTTGSATASGTVTTDEANGTLYAVVTASATPPSAADIRLGTGAVYATSQAVTVVGVKNVAATGLTASTAYYWHFLHDDAAANASNIVTSAGFTTDAAPVAGIAVTNPLKNNTGTLLANATGVSVAVLQASNLASVYAATGLTTNASGVLAQVANAAIIAATSYHVVIKLADGSVGITGPITAT